MQDPPVGRGQVPDALPPIAGLMNTASPIKHAERPSGANLYLLCESPTIFSKKLEGLHKQEQQTKPEFHKTFQGVRKVQPKRTKLASVSHMLARSIVPSRSNPWNKPVPKPTENVIHRMNNAPAAGLQSEPINRRPILPGGIEDSSDEDDDPPYHQVQTQGKKKKRGGGSQQSHYELPPSLEAKYRPNKEAEEVTNYSTIEKTGKLRSTNTFVRKQQDQVLREGDMAYEKNEDDDVELPPIRRVYTDISVKRKKKERNTGGSASTNGSIRAPMLFSSDSEGDLSATEGSPKRSPMVGFKQDPTFGTINQSFAIKNQSPGISVTGPLGGSGGGSGGARMPKWATKSSLKSASSKKYLVGNPQQSTSLKRTESSLTKAEQQRQAAAEVVKSEVDKFESVVDERRALEEFLQPRPRTIPNMVIKQFRHHLTAESDLVLALRALPLKKIEQAITDLQGSRAMTLIGFNTFLTKLLGENMFSKVESQQTFCYFDTDGDGDCDQKELQNGIIQVLSMDGPLVPVLHRCQSMVRPRTIRDTRLLSLSRFELVVMSEAVVHVTKDPKTGAPDQEVVAALQRVLESFRCDKKGQFPFDRVREEFMKSEVLVKAVDSFTVPREQHLYDSFLSQFYRTGDAEEGDTQFRLMHTERTDRRVAQENEKKDILAGQSTKEHHLAGGAKNSGASPSVTPMENSLEPGDGSILGLSGGAGGRRVSNASHQSHQSHHSGDGKHSHLSAASPMPDASLSPGNRSVSPAFLTPRTLQAKKKLLMLSKGKKEPAEKKVLEPFNPVYFTYKGVLMRQLEGEKEPSRFWVPGMETPKYTLDPKDRAPAF